MTGQRMVPVELLRTFSALLQKHNDQGDDARPVFAINDALITLGDLRKLRAIIDGPGVEPVAAAVLSYNAATDWYDVVSADQSSLRLLCKTSASGMATLYLAVPQPPATAQSSAVACPLVDDPEGRN